MRAGFEDKNVAASIYDIDKFKLDTQEAARVCLIDPDVEIGLAHYIQGFPESAKKNGYYSCLGNYDVIIGAGEQVGQGVDPAHCAFCGRAARNSNIGLPTQRFGTTLLRYMTDNKGTIKNFGNTFGYEFPLFIFGPDKYRRVLEIKKAYAPVLPPGVSIQPLQIMDLLVKCENKGFQKFQIDPIQPCLWFSAPADVKAAVVKEWRSKRRTDLLDVMGNSISLADMHKLIAELDATGPAGAATGAGMPLASVATAAEVQALLNTSSPETSKPISSPPTADDLGFGGPKTLITPPPTPPPIQQQTPPPPPFVPAWTGTNCSLCSKPQFTSPSGNTCENGHGGASPQSAPGVPTAFVASTTAATQTATEPVQTNATVPEVAKDDFMDLLKG